MSHSVLIPVADGSEDMETVIMLDVLRRAGAEVTLASVTGQAEVRASRGTRIVTDALLADVIDADWDLIVLPGGLPGAEALADCPALIARLRRQRDEGRWYGAICASPGLVLAPNGLLEGMNATGHPGFRENLPDHSRADERVVVDRHCITSQGPGTAMEYALTLVALLFGTAKRDEVAAPMVL